MKKLFLVILPVILLGCLEESLEQNPPEIDVPVIGMMNAPIEILIANELSMAKSFCSSLSEKEETFPRQYIGATISFTVKQRDCSENKADLKTAVVKAKLGSDSRSGNLRYFPMDYYLPLMTEVETTNQGIFSEFCPDLLLNVQKTNSRELPSGEVQIFRFLPDGESQVMVQVLTSDESESEVNRIQEVSVAISGTQNKPRGLVVRKIDLTRCGNLSGNENASFWSQEI